MKTNPSDPDVGCQRYCVRDVEEPDLGISEYVSSPKWSISAYGSGELWGAASDEIKDRIDFEDHVGEDVAVVTIDVDAWDFQIDWLVEDDRRLVDRIRGFVP